MRATRGAIGGRGGATLRSHESGSGGATRSRTHARAHVYACMSIRGERGVPWIMSALWYRCINLTKRRINLITSQRMSRRMMYRRGGWKRLVSRGNRGYMDPRCVLCTAHLWCCLILCKHDGEERKREKARDGWGGRRGGSRVLIWRDSTPSGSAMRFLTFYSGFVI